ncbi:hypothetical protein FQN52_006691 [Onygenales sp. PD_12]|nr:hypothetical protein FQN52_006691 [Onygenales sp. PD_12]
MPPPNLSTILTPTLLTHLALARMPFSQTNPLNFTTVGHTIFHSTTFASTIKDLAWPALKAISTLGLPNLPTNLLQYLPPPSSPDFPLQALGLQVLFDQAPRALCAGVDVRYRYAYFDILSQRLAGEWAALPPHQRPDTWERWEALGVSFDWWVVARFWFGAAWVHEESLAGQEMAVGYTNGTREAVEGRTGVRDEYRDDGGVWTDVCAFPRVYMEGPPGEVGMGGFVFWMCMLMDTHKVVIETFGRYPTVNAAVGRESTGDEERWLAAFPGWREVEDEVREVIRRDVWEGSWAPLGDEPRGEGEKN